jgi:hypothetical protein
MCNVKGYNDTVTTAAYEKNLTYFIKAIHDSVK